MIITPEFLFDVAYANLGKGTELIGEGESWIKVRHGSLICRVFAAETINNEVRVILQAEDGRTKTLLVSLALCNDPLVPQFP